MVSPLLVFAGSAFVVGSYIFKENNKAVSTNSPQEVIDSFVYFLVSECKSCSYQPFYFLGVSVKNSSAHSFDLYLLQNTTLFLLFCTNLYNSNQLSEIW